MTVIKVLPALLFILSYLSADDFITEFEYGQMLYQNPRGVSCIPCHGERGEGGEIARYRDKDGKIVVLEAPDIRKATLSQIAKAVNSGPGVMPRYFLTDKEIHAIYIYLQK